MTRNRSIATAAVLLLGLAGCGGNGEPKAETPSTTPPSGASSARSFPSDEDFVPVESGLYRVPRAGAVAGYDVTVPAGWGVEHGEVLTKNPSSSGAITIEAWALSEVSVFDDACHGEGVKGAPPADAAGLAAALRAQKSGPRVGTPAATTLAGKPATEVDLKVVDQDLSDCRVPGYLQVWNGYLVLVPHETAKIYVVGTGADQQVFVARTGDKASAADRQELQAILASIRFAANS